MLFRLSFGLLKAQMKEYCDMSVVIFWYRSTNDTTAQHANGKHAEKLDWWNIWGAQEDILPGQSVCFHKNSVAINLPWDTQLKTWKYLTVKAIRPEHAKQEIKSIYKNWPSLTWLFWSLCMFYYILTFVLPPCYIIKWFIWLYYTVSLSVLNLSVEFFFFFGTCFVSADKIIEKHGRIHVLTINNRRQFNNHLWLLQWKCWSESRSSWTSIQTYANEGHWGFMHGFICFCE